MLKFFKAFKICPQTLNHVHESCPNIQNDEQLSENLLQRITLFNTNMFYFNAYMNIYIQIIKI